MLSSSINVGRTRPTGLRSVLTQSAVILCRLILNNLQAGRGISFSPWKALDYSVGGLCDACTSTFSSVICETRLV